MTAGAIIDPDLVQAIDDLRFVVGRVEILNQQINHLDEVEGYGRIVAMKTERSDLLDQVRARAEKMAVAPRALMLLVGTANRLRTPRKSQLPPLSTVRGHIEIAAAASLRDQEEAEAEAKIARVTARGAAIRAKAGADALAYLDASRS